MRRTWRQKLALLQTPYGRSELRGVLRRRFWPVLRRLAMIYRRSIFLRKTHIIAVVGSFGKSTTMAAVTTAVGRKVHRRAPYNANGAVADALLRIRPFDRHAVIEVGIGAPGQMAPYARLVRPQITVVTSIGSEHQQSLKTLEVTRWEKAEMVRILPLSGLAVLNGDDPNVLWMRGETHARVITFGFGESNDVRGSDVALDWPTGLRLKVHAAGQTRLIRTRLIGKHMAYPILAAVAVSLTEGFGFDEIVSRLEAFEAVPGRMQAIPLSSGAVMIGDEFKSTLETVDAALDAFSEITPAGRRIVVLGEVTEAIGSQGPIYRRLGGRVAEIASRVIFVGQSGNCGKVSNGAKLAGLPKESFFKAGESVAAAVEALRSDLRPGDVVLLKGRQTQHLERISLALQGRRVHCNLKFCRLKTNCANCLLLEEDLGDASELQKRSPIIAQTTQPKNKQNTSPIQNKAQP